MLRMLKQQVPTAIEEMSKRNSMLRCSVFHSNFPEVVCVAFFILRRARRLPFSNFFCHVVTWQLTPSNLKQFIFSHCKKPGGRCSMPGLRPEYEEHGHLGNDTFNGRYRNKLCYFQTYLPIKGGSASIAKFYRSLPSVQLAYTFMSI